MPGRWLRISTVLVGFAASVASAFAADGESLPFTVYGAGRSEMIVSRGGEDYLRWGLAAWGPNWAWAGIRGESKNDRGAAIASLTARIGGAEPVRIDFRAERLASNRFQFEYRLQADAEVRLTLIVVEMAPGKSFEGRDVMVQSASNSGDSIYNFQCRGQYEPNAL